MKKLLLSFVSVLLVLASCNREEYSDPDTLVKGEKLHFHGVKQALSTKGLGQRDKLWVNETVITVKLLDDPFNLTEELKSYAKEWEQYANITFKFVPPGENALVRIGFNWNDEKYVTWSYTGSDCKYVKDQTEATANLADFDLLSAAERKCEGLRLFGQILGLELEHRHITANPEWRSITKVEEYWTENIADIPWSELTAYVFNPISGDNYVATDSYDANSIMVWPFPKTVLRYMNGAVNTGTGNCTLSELDKVFIAKLYPADDDGGNNENNPKVTEIRPLREKCAYLHRINNGSEIIQDGGQVQLLGWTWSGVPGEVRQVLSFDLAELKSTSQIEKITLNLYSELSPTAWHGRANSGLNNAIYVQQIIVPWALNSITWATPRVRTDNRATVPHTSAAVLDVQVDVTGMVKDMIDNNRNHGFLLQLESPAVYTSRIFYSTDESISGPSKVPTLSITYKQ